MDYKLNSDINNNQYDNNSYFNKYNKYKKKYLDLKQQINSINGGNTCLPYGKNAHMFTAFKFEDIKNSFGSCKSTDTESLKWLREKIDANNQKNKDKKFPEFWPMEKIKEELEIPVFLEVFKDSKPEIYKNFSLIKLKPHVPLAELKKVFPLASDDEIALTDVFKIKELLTAYPAERLRELINFKVFKKEFTLKELSKMFPLSEIVEEYDEKELLKEFKLKELKPHFRDPYYFYQSSSFKDLTDAGYTLYDFARSKEDFALSPSDLFEKHIKENVFTLKEFKKVYGQRMCNFNGITVEQMISAGFKFEELIKMKCADPEYEKNERWIYELLYYMLDQYHYKNKDFDYETVSRYIKELFQIWSKNHRRYVHLLRQSFVTTKFTNTGFIDGTKGEDINGWLDKEFS